MKKDIETSDDKLDSAEALLDETELSAECRRIQSKYVLVLPKSEEVFNEDRPQEANRLGAELAVKTLSQEHTVGNKLRIKVTEVYSPFQFWFLEAKDADLVTEMSHKIFNFHSDGHGLCWMLTPHFLKPGYICAAFHQSAWKRARIVSVISATEVSVYMLDYGQSVKLPANQLNFLHKNFMQHPAMAMRGTLTDVYPLDFHWSANATNYFKLLVRGHYLYADIKDTDIEDRTLFVNLCVTPDTQLSISDQLISGKLAGISRNYSAKTIESNNGRRVRYIRERLPSFDMLEQQLIIADCEKFEDMFDRIVYNSQFYKLFKAPKLTNPFRKDLEDALADWLEKHKHRRNP
ncbi:tudor domain-containing protein 1 [Drosophila sulfurigaster albostrigata]|uniref:tudor domain-containing protein 1 n=1 Tax=Drosophila sulfurigaster albostrigata TaxID=89887 RepID=UPI002D21B764|nr:tudor domain-containing protein 1 [Drosophila sulfurigaster albostrigata]